MFIECLATVTSIIACLGIIHHTVVDIVSKAHFLLIGAFLCMMQLLGVMAEAAVCKRMVNHDTLLRPLRGCTMCLIREMSLSGAFAAAFFFSIIVLIVAYSVAFGLIRANKFLVRK